MRGRPLPLTPHALLIPLFRTSRSPARPDVPRRSTAAAPALVSGTLTALGESRVWFGLKNSDDQGTYFDVRAEVSKNGTLLASGETRCVQGITRNPANAKEVILTFGPVSAAAFNGTTDVLSLKVLTRIGTTATGARCGGHSNAVGLRLYFDAVSRAAQVTATF